MKTPHVTAVAVLATLLAGTGCASLQSVSMTNIPRGAERTRPIQARENNVAFLGIHFDNSFADAVPEELRRQCPDGKVTGVYAKYESKWYVLVEDRSVTAKAYCVPKVAEAPPSPPTPSAPAAVPAPSALPPAPAPSSLPAAPAPAASVRVHALGGSS